MLALTPEQRRPLADLMELMLALTSLSVVLLMAMLHYETWRVATSVSSELSLAARTGILLVIGSVVLLIPVWLIAFNRRLKAITSEAGE